MPSNPHAFNPVEDAQGLAEDGAFGDLDDDSSLFRSPDPGASESRSGSDTFSAMSTSSLALKARTDHLIANLRGIDERRSISTVDVVRTPLAEIISLPVTLPKLAVAPTTRQLDSTSRLTVRLGGQSLGELMGWACGPLEVEVDGAWIVLRPSSSHAGRRHDGRPVLSGAARDRLRLPEQIRRRLGVSPGEEVLLVALPDSGALAISNPVQLLLGAPLRALAASPS